MNLYCCECNIYLGLVHLLPVADFVIDSYCQPCNRKFENDLQGVRLQESLINNDADLEFKFKALINQCFST